MDECLKLLNEKANEEETILQFIRNSEKSFEMEEVNLNDMSLKELNEYIDFLDYLWTK